MKKYYKIQEKSQKTTKNTRRCWGDFLWNFTYKFLSYILPVQNPDFEKILGNVEYWFIEFDDNIPTKEIGFDSKNTIICKMPFWNNFWFWIDSNMELSDFLNNENFEVLPITESIFQKKWRILKK